MLVPITYAVYLLISVTITVWVARTLFRNGLIFLEDAFGNPEMAKAVNHLLWVGFYLVNIGFVFLFLKTSNKPENLIEAIEYVSIRVGVVLLVLGGLHFFNVFNFAKIRRKSRVKPMPPVKSQTTVAAAVNPDNS